ncbi:MAG: phosphoglucosamine mutase [Pseudanabaenaceae cyanobacterium]
MQLFGTDGIRGEFGSFLTPKLAYQIGTAVGRVWGDPQQGVILVGQDSRRSSPVLSQQITAGLQAQGWSVWQLGLCPTPAVAYLTAVHPHIYGGIMVSASHNPPSDNGIKFFQHDGSKLPHQLQTQVEELIPHVPVPDPLPEPDLDNHQLELIQHYQASLLKTIPQPLDNLHIVLDLAWGSATRLGREIFQALGAQVTAIHDQPDGDRINVRCGSTHLDPLHKAVAELGADLGFAFDGDADRVLAVTKQGRVINGDEMLYFWGRELLGQGRLPQGTIVTTVMANLGFERAWQKQGGQLIRTPVGDQHVHSQMLATGAMLGGEQSGHILCRHYSISGDGLMTGIHFASLVQQYQLEHLLAESFTPFPQLLYNVKIPHPDQRRNWQQCEPLLQKIHYAEQQLGERGRIVIRPSGTEPVIRVMVEAQTHDLAQQWTAYLVEAVLCHLG